jgi:hypothetical protein
LLAAIAAVTVGCAALAVTPAAFAVPPNNDFASATPIQRIDDAANTNLRSGNNTGAFAEFGEPDHRDNTGTPAGGGTSVWYSWTPTWSEDAMVLACTHLSGVIPGDVDFDPLLGVYTGAAVNALTPQGTNSSLDCFGIGPVDIQNSFQAQSGTTYHFAVAGASGDEGDFIIVLEQRPANDAFANSVLLTGMQGQVNGDDVFASDETGEPSHGGNGQSVWYRWKAPVGGRASFNTCDSEPDTQLAVYTGSAVNALTPVAANDDTPSCGKQSKVSFNAQKDTMYRIAIDSIDSESLHPGAITLNYIEFKTPETTITAGPAGPTNDATPTFKFKSSVTGSTFRCRFDAHAFAPCSGPGATHTPASALTNGAHTFSVRAVNGQAVDPTPATRSFIVDTVRPQTTITSGPSGVTHDNTPTFRFSSNETGSTFQCLIRLASGSGTFGSCSGPGASHTPSLPLANGKYVFSVRARDKAGNLDSTPASRAFTVAP